MLTTFDTVVSFGDSFSSQCGSRNSIGYNRNAWTDFHHGLFDNPIYNNCSANEGYNYLNFLTGCFGDDIDPLKCPLRMFDLAFARAETSPRVVLTSQNAADISILSLEEQLNQWTQEVRPNIELNEQKTLATVWFGLNDLAVLEGEGAEDKIEHEDALDTEVEILRRLKVIEHAMNTLAQTGVHSFLIPNVPLDLFDGAALILEWNRLLRRLMTAWISDNPEMKVYLFDAFDLYNQFLSFPEKYGFTNTQDYCVSARFEEPGLDCAKTVGKPLYLRMDWVHWTTRAHMALASAIAKFITEQQTLSDATQVGPSRLSGINLFIFRHYKAVIYTLLLATMSMATVLLFVLIRLRTAVDGITEYSPLELAELQSLDHAKDRDPDHAQAENDNTV